MPEIQVGGTYIFHLHPDKPRDDRLEAADGHKCLVLSRAGTLLNVLFLGQSLQVRAWPDELEALPVSD